ncbi:hypothetical protein BJX63DRAFT_433795 [Aspergillus granulosus]|uniref:Uncharacterized protein n=1 Tax=Aspergillus granulosus TaxID=176169 RepID=A0ABR4H845_9EURO
MRYTTVSLANALAVLPLSLGTLAQDCKTAEDTITVSTPEDLDIFRGSCTTITGNIEISASYVDDFILEGVTDVVGNISIPDSTNPGTLGAFTVPDLVNVGAIILHQAIEINLPNLERAGDILLNPWLSGEVNLRSLREVDNVWVYGGWRSVDLSSLETVHGKLEFSRPKSDSIFPADQVAPLEINLPALKTAKELDVGGYATSFSAPDLEALGDPDSEYPYSLLVAIRNHIEVEFPKLQTLVGGNTMILGNIARISLPALAETSEVFEFNTETPVEIYSTIETATQFRLWGKIKSIELPNMVDLGSISFAEEIRPCNETLVKLWEAVPSHGPPGHESSWYWRCWREDLPEDTTDTLSAAGDTDDDTDDDDEPAGAEEDIADTTTLPESDSGSESGLGEEAADGPGSEEAVPGDTGAFLAPPRLCGLVMLLSAVVVSFA